jgi:GH15 family glucan-1,4-alpha-glucosidase
MTLQDRDAGSRLVRRVKAVRGSIHVRMRCLPRFDYARVDHKIRAEGGTVIFTGGDGLALRLRASVPVDVSDGAALTEFDLAAGEHNWQRPDEGIWEVRGGRRDFLHSRLMCWVAFDRAIRLARKRSLPAPLVEWSQTRDAIYQEVHTAFWDPEQRAFVQSKGSTTLDASCLLMPLMRFISPTDPRWLSTLKAVGDRLLDDSLVYRYSHEAEIDGLRGGEGTFNMCSFWYVECLARAGDVKQARLAFRPLRFMLSTF